MAAAKRFLSENMVRIVMTLVTILVLGGWYTALGYSRIEDVEQNVLALEEDVEYIQKEIMEALHELQIDTAILKEQVTYLAEEAKENDVHN